MNEIFNPIVNKTWTELNSKQVIITKILEMAKNNQLSVRQKQTLLQIVNNSPRTEKQKNRFIKFYNLDMSKDQNYTLTTLAKECGCKSSAIKYSLSSVITYTLLHDDENFIVLKKMIEA